MNTCRRGVRKLSAKGTCVNSVLKLVQVGRGCGEGNNHSGDRGRQREDGG